jgi:hypothetical protein
MNYSVCPDCGEENPSNRVHCLKCGTHLQNVQVQKGISLSAPPSDNNWETMSLWNKHSCKEWNAFEMGRIILRICVFCLWARSTHFLGNGPNFIKILIMITIGTAALYYIAWLIDAGRQSKAWPSVNGQIIYSAWGTAWEIAGNEDIDVGGPHEYVVVRYIYMVKSKTYESKVVAPWGVVQSAKKTVEKYPLGAKVAVYYNLNDPTLATLETGVSIKHLVWVLVASGLLMYAVGW